MPPRVRLRTMSHMKDAGAPPNESAELSNLQEGDVLVAHPSAVREHDISIVPEKPHATVATHHEAVVQATAKAQELAVDAWLTEDRIHVIKLATHRPDDV